MKTPSGTLALAVLAVVVLLAIGSCCVYENLVDNQQAFLLLGTKTRYVQWKKKELFDAAICRPGVFFDLKALVSARDKPIYPYNPCPTLRSIRTVKVTKSKHADSTAAGESAGDDPNVVYKVAAASIKDIQTIMGTLRDPSPTPTP